MRDRERGRNEKHRKKETDTVVLFLLNTFSINIKVSPINELESVIV